MSRPIVFVAALVLMGTTIGVAQQKRAVTTADYDRAVKMLAPALNGLVVGDSANVTWLPDGRFWYARTTLTGTENIVIDPVGGAANAAALRAMAWRGRMVIIGFAAGEIPTIKANYLLVKNIEVSGLQWSDYRDRTPEWVARVQHEIFALYVAGKIDPYVSRTFPLAGVKDALTLLQQGKAQGKLILEIA